LGLFNETNKRNEIMKKIILIACVLITGASAALASTFYDDSGDGLWGTAANWWDGAAHLVPTASDVAYIKGGKTVAVTGGLSATALDVYVGNDSAGALNLDGGGSITSGRLFVGAYTGGEGTMTVDGNMSFSGSIFIGHSDGVGHLTLNGGTTEMGSMLRVGTAAGSSGTLTINNGATLKTASTAIQWTDSSTTTIALDLGGTMIFAGDASGTVGWGLSHDMIVATGSATGIDWDYNVTTPGETTVTAIPEPATISLSLIALGGLVVARRLRV